jgi:hypothetical protein
MRVLIAVAIAASALAACSSNRSLSADGGGAGAAGTTVITFDQVINRNVDVIFMVDDSSSMAPLQTKLTATFSSYVDVLKALPGGLPNIHLGVVSSSMGAGRNPSLDHCPQGGDQGIFHTKPLGFQCAKASLDAGQNFIINVNGQANYTGELADVFGCIALLGDGGCGFEHQLESVLRALGADGAPPPPENANFLRPDAFLQVVLLTDEDDCSAPPDSDLFDSSSMTLTDPLGPLQSYRCNEFGHLCGGKKPPRMPPGEVDLGTCVSAEDGRLLRVADIVKALKGLKADPRKVFVAALAANTTPYKVNVGPSQIKGDTSLWPFVEHSCIQTDPGGSQTYGDPAVRIKQWVDGFGGNGIFQSLCIPSYTPALQAIAGQIGAALSGTPCFPATVDPSKCTLVEHAISSNGTVGDIPLPRCADSADPGPCWDVPTTSASCPAGHGVAFRRPSGSPQAESTTATCSP